MRALTKTGIGLAVVAAVMVLASSAVLHAQGVAPAPSAAERALTSQSRPISGAVTAIEAGGPIDVIVTQGAGASLTVRAEQRMLSYITTEQQGNVLRIDSRGLNGLHGRHPVRVEVSLPALTAISVNGSGDLVASGFNGEALELALRGSGDVRVSGHFRRVKAGLNGSGDLHLDAGSSELVDLTVNGSGDVSASGKTAVLNGQIRGSGDIRAAQLQADSASIKIYGSGDADIFARQKVEASTAGSGDIHISGQPAVRAVSRAGSGEVSWN